MREADEDRDPDLRLRLLGLDNQLAVSYAYHDKNPHQAFLHTYRPGASVNNSIIEEVNQGSKAVEIGVLTPEARFEAFATQTSDAFQVAIFSSLSQLYLNGFI